MTLVPALTRRPTGSLAALLLLSQWCLASGAFAQFGTGTLTGKVTDAATGAPVADVVVTATSEQLQGEQIVVTDASGTFHIPTLPPGEYTLRYEGDTYRPFSRSGIALRASVTLRADAQLLPETVAAEEVTIVAKAPTVDVGSTRQGVTINSDFTDRVPVAPPTGKGAANRSFEQLAEIAPGVRNDTYGASVAGTTSVENVYMIDGIAVGNPGFGYNGSPFGIDFIKETSVITGGYLPEYGRGGGGILDVTTKSGSNEFHGSVFGNVMPWSASPKFPAPQDTISTTYALDSVRDFGFDLGGPIVKDKLWFYVGADVSKLSYELIRDLNALSVDASGEYLRDADGLIVSERIPGTHRTLLAEQTGIQYIAKLTFAPDEDNRFELTHRGTPTRSGGDGMYSVDYETGLPNVAASPGARIIGPYEPTAWQQIADSYSTSLKWTHAALNKRLTFDTILGWDHQRTADLAADGTIGGPGISGDPLFSFGRTNPMPHSITDFENIPDPSICMNPVAMGDLRCPAADYLVGGPQILSDRYFNRVQARELVTFVTEGLGHHIVKAGIEFEYMGYESMRGYPGGPLLSESAGGANTNDLRRFGGLTAPDEAYTLPLVRINTYTLSFGTFLQDSWSIMDKVTLNAGLRYDTQSLYADQGLGMRLPNQWSPRLGLIYDPTQEGRAKLYANYAIYYQTFPLNVMDRAGSGEPQIRSSRPFAACNPSAPNYPEGCDNPDVLNSTGPNGPNSKWSYLSTGRLAVDPDIKSQSTSEFSVGGEYEIITDGRIGVSYIRRWMNNVLEDMSRDEGNSYFVGNPGSGIASDFPEAERTYDAGILYFTKTFSDDWLAQASYTLSYLRGNWEGLFRAQTGQLDPGTNSDFDLRSLVINRTGPLSGDRRHEIKLFLARDIELARRHHLDVGTSYRARSGAPTNYLGEHLLYGSDEVFLLARGTGDRMPWVHNIDLHVGYTFFETKDARIQITADIFNLFNFQAVVTRTQRYTNRPVEPITGDAAKDPFLDAERKVIDPSRIVASDGDPRPFDDSDRYLAFGAPTSYQPPISMRIGVKGSF